jgi:hypothetical protein
MFSSVNEEKNENSVTILCIIVVSKKLPKKLKKKVQRNSLIFVNKNHY